MANNNIWVWGEAGQQYTLETFPSNTLGITATTRPYLVDITATQKLLAWFVGGATAAVNYCIVDITNPASPVVGPIATPTPPSGGYSTQSPGLGTVAISGTNIFILAAFNSTDFFGDPLNNYDIMQLTYDPGTLVITYTGTNQSLSFTGPPSTSASIYQLSSTMLMFLYSTGGALSYRPYPITGGVLQNPSSSVFIANAGASSETLTSCFVNVTGGQGYLNAFAPASGSPFFTMVLPDGTLSSSSTPSGLSHAYSDIDYGVWSHADTPNVAYMVYTSSGGTNYLVSLSVSDTGVVTVLETVNPTAETFVAPPSFPANGMNGVYCIGGPDVYGAFELSSMSLGENNAKVLSPTGFSPTNWNPNTLFIGYIIPNAVQAPPYISPGFFPVVWGDNLAICSFIGYLTGSIMYASEIRVDLIAPCLETIVSDLTTQYYFTISSTGKWSIGRLQW